MLFEPVIASTALKRLDKTLQLVADKDVTVTFLGESGTGKDVLARRLHELSGRRAGPFVPINCAAIPEALVESELFGREKGAFTGASERAPGKIEVASGGTLFLDEVGELPLAVQPKLLRFLETRRFMRLGGTTKHSADVRLVLATLRPLEDEVKSGRFRADLYYRIQGITVTVPPLRERRADIEPLLDSFLDYFAAKHGVARPRLPRRVRSLLVGAPWPGNVRELRNLVEQLCLLHPGERIGVDALPRSVVSEASDGGTAPDHVEVPLTASLAEVEERFIDAVLRASQGNRARAARSLGISVRTLARRLSRAGAPRALSNPRPPAS
ncbi:MAG: sigma 54-interacting transcriptional regulator [Myxococcota bacterium]